jgi:hypothetical protein
LKYKNFWLPSSGYALFLLFVRLAKECYSMKLDLLTNATVVDDALRFVYNKSQNKQKIKSDISEGDKEESRELDYNEDQLEEEQEVEFGEITVNQVF